jgi:effector-binding domain-containing protein
MRELFTIFVFLLFISCVNNSTRDTTKGKKELSTIKTDTIAISIEQEKRKSSVIIEEVKPRRQLYVVMKESAFTQNDLEKKRLVLNNNLMFYLNTCNQQATGYPAAWFSNDNSLQFIESGLPVNGKCDKKEPGVYYKELTEKIGIKAIFKGPLDKIQIAYDSLQSWATRNKKILKPNKIFIYKIDGTTEKDASMHETEIIMYY